VSGETIAIGVVRGEVSGGGDIEGLHINESEGPRAVKTADDDVGTVGEAIAGGLHPLGDLAAGGRTLGENGGRTESFTRAFI